MFREEIQTYKQNEHTQGCVVFEWSEKAKQNLWSQNGLEGHLSTDRKGRIEQEGSVHNQW